MKMVIPRSCDIRFLCSSIRIEQKNATFERDLKNRDFDSQVERHDENSKLEEGLEKSRLVNENVHTWLM